MLPVSRLWFGSSRPTVLISGQSVCAGCGSDVMLCARESLLTNRTRVPGEMVHCVALTPAAVMVMVVDVPPPPPGDGDGGDPPPQAARGMTISAGSSLRTPGIIPRPP